MVEFATMKSTPRTLTRQEWTRLILGMTLVLGLVVRIFPLLLAGFPLNDGGMFLVMIRDLRANSFVLPAFTTYNLSNIPFAYPPLGFYAGAILNVLGVRELDILKWLPASMNIASVLAFFLLARSLLKDGPRAAIATLVYALVPGSFAWQIMGGGLSRSFGMLFILLANYSVYRVFQEGKWKWVWIAILFCSLSVLSHPEVALATATSCALFWAFFGRSKRGSLQATVIAFGTLLLTALWWGSVITAHGLAPFQAVLHSGAYVANPLRTIVVEFFAFDLWTGLFHILFLIGLAWSLFRKQFFLPLWVILPYFVEPRSAPAFAYIPESILAAQALVDGLLLVGDRFRKRNVGPAGPPEFIQRNEANVVVLVLLFLWFLQSSFFGFRLANTSLRPPEPQEAMTWARQNVAGGSEFVIITGNRGVMTDPLQEWFPALAERNSRTTLQGLEWTLGPQFFPRLKELADLQPCQDVQCLEVWSARTGLTYSHLLLERNDATEPVIHSLLAADGYRLLYENGDYLIFEKVNEKPRAPLRG